MSIEEQRNTLDPKNNSLRISSIDIIQSGPLPSPEVLARYEQIRPGFADRIIKLAEHQATHHQEIDKIYLSKSFSQQRLGQILGFLIGIIAIVAGAYVGSTGNQWTGSIIGGSGVVGLVSVFVSGRKEKT